MQEFYNSPGVNYVSQAQGDSLFEKWGGIPRYVLEKANSERAQTDLDVAISKCTTHDIMTYTGAEGAPEHISHKLLHMIVQRDPPEKEGHTTSQLIDMYSKYEIGIASDYVAKKLTGMCSRFWKNVQKINFYYPEKFRGKNFVLSN